MLGRAVATKQTVQIVDLRDEQEQIGLAPGTTGGVLVKLAGALTTVAVPMLKRNELIGAILIYRQEVRPFTDKQIALVEMPSAWLPRTMRRLRILKHADANRSDPTQARLSAKPPARSRSSRSRTS